MNREQLADAQDQADFERAQLEEQQQWWELQDLDDEWIEEQINGCNKVR